MFNKKFTRNKVGFILIFINKRSKKRHFQNSPNFLVFIRFSFFFVSKKLNIFLKVIEESIKKVLKNNRSFDKITIFELCLLITL